MAKEEDLFHLAFSFKGIPVVDKFVGPNAEITRLAKLMIFSSTNSMHRKVCLLHGIGGVGISQLAAEFARNHQQNFSAIVRIAGSTKEKLRRSIAALAQRLPQHQIPEKARSLSQDTVKDCDAIIEDVLKWFSQPSNNKWLFIIDNVDRVSPKILKLSILGNICWRRTKYLFLSLLALQIYGALQEAL